ncbi:WhiB family transcriptional regulator [Kitasatospora terrestris]|uniref:4Fe-4S Wbl-type domain-containing protein n=1 Tax=Kitasatospora terrestris TaxID=258051 RepID=A0ABP9E1Z3_9ACTN
MPGTTLNRGETAPAAPCAGADIDADLFFPAVDGTDHRRPTTCEQRALAVCAECPLARRATCLEDALAYPASEQYGVVGGTTASQRRVILFGRALVARLGVAA